MKHFALIGHPVAHSYSARLHNEWFKEHHVDADYRLIDMPGTTEFRHVMEGLDGANVTIPYKQAVIEQLDDLSSEARAAKAVNTVVWRDGRLTGHNTDIGGFRKLFGGNHFDGRVLLLGSGGAAKAVECVLHENMCEYSKVNRLGLETMRWPVKDYDVVINATPLGMWPDVKSCPNIDYEGMDSTKTAIDLVYNPNDTEFLKRCRAHGAKCRHGIVMLREQARLARELFLDI